MEGRARWTATGTGIHRSGDCTANLGLHPDRPAALRADGEAVAAYGLADDGALVLARGEERQLLRRRFD